MTKKVKKIAEINILENGSKSSKSKDSFISNNSQQSIKYQKIENKLKNKASGISEVSEINVIKAKHLIQIKTLINFQESLRDIKLHTFNINKKEKLKNELVKTKYSNSPYLDFDANNTKRNKWNAYDKIEVKLRFRSKYKNMIDK